MHADVTEEGFAHNLINDFLSFYSLVYFYIIVLLEHPLRHVSRALSLRG